MSGRNDVASDKVNFISNNRPFFFKEIGTSRFSVALNSLSAKVAIVVNQLIGFNMMSTLASNELKQFGATVLR